MNYKTTLAALAASTFLVLSGAALAADTAAPAATTTKSATTTPAATPAPAAVPFKGAAANFKAGDDLKTVVLQKKNGDWYKLSFANACKPLDGAKTVKLSQTKNVGKLWVGKVSCKVASFEKTEAPAGSAMAPAPTTPAPATTPTH